MIIVLTTYPDAKRAAEAAKGMVQSELAACVSVVKAEKSYYIWKGKLETGPEWLLVIKTTHKAWRALRSFIRKNHPHRVPEIIQVECADAEPDYLSWVRDNTVPSPFMVPLALRAARRASRPSKASTKARKPKTSSR